MWFDRWLKVHLWLFPHEIEIAVMKSAGVEDVTFWKSVFICCCCRSDAQVNFFNLECPLCGCQLSHLLVNWLVSSHFTGCLLLWHPNKIEILTVPFKNHPTAVRKDRKCCRGPIHLSVQYALHMHQPGLMLLSHFTVTSCSGSDQPLHQSHVTVCWNDNIELCHLQRHPSAPEVTKD